MASVENSEFESKDAVSVVVPVYKSSGSLAILHARLTQVFATLACNYEIIFVEDGGSDGSWQSIESLSLNDSRVRGLRLGRNYGQHNALLCGIRAAKYPVCITLDDDLQHPPEEIPTLLEELERGFDVVYGAPEKEQHNFWRDTASVVTKMVLMNAMGAQTARHVSAFRAFRTRLRDAFNNYSSPFVSIDVLLTWGTTRFTHKKVRHEPRTIGVSNYTLWRLVTHAMNMMTGFSTLPLQIASFVGFGCTFLGLILLFYVLIQYFLFGRSVPGFYFLASTITVFAGAQLFALGMIGEYLARIHFRTMNKPPYTVMETTAEPASFIPRVSE